MDHSRDTQQSETGYVHGRVPWGWREAIFALLIAVSPILVLKLLDLVTSTSSSKAKASASTAVVAVAFTLVIDLWYVAWAWRFSLRKFSLRWTSWGFRPPVLATVWLVPLSLAIVYTVNFAQNRFIKAPQQQFISAFPHNAVGTVLFVVLVCVIAPIFEEMFYRGFLFQGLARTFGPLWGAIISAAVFSAAHQQATIFIPIFTLGLLLCWVFYRTGSLWTNIILHATFNTIAMLVWAFSG